MLHFDDIAFEDKEDTLRVVVYNHFYKDFSRSEIEEKVGEYEVKDGKLTLTKYDDDRCEKRFMRFFRRFKTDLTYKLNENKSYYVDEDLGLPLVGLNFMGLVDKGSEMIEIKPITNCNASCSFCSVNEGYDSDKEIDFVVDLDYLISETKALLAFKEAEGMSLWINPHGDPTLYPKLKELVEGLIDDAHVKDMHIITNGMLLTKSLVDGLREISDNSKKPIYISLSMSGLGTKPLDKSKLNKEGLSTSQLMMGRYYNVNSVLRNVEYAATKLNVTITPVFVTGMNDDEMKDLIALSQGLSEKASTNKVGIALQKFCKNKRGRNPAKEESWESFFEKLGDLEKETGVKLTQPLGKLQQTKQLPKICQKKEMVKVQILCPGRYKRDRLGILETPEGRRAVTVVGCHLDKGAVKGQVLQNKYNIALVKCGA